MTRSGFLAGAEYRHLDISVGTSKLW